MKWIAKLCTCPAWQMIAGLQFKATLWLGGSACLAAIPLAAADEVQTAQSFSGQVVLNVHYRYLLALPEGYAATPPDRKWPLVVFLHGAGERGHDLELIKRHGPPKLIAAGMKLPAIVASLQCEPNHMWDPHGVKAVADHLLATLLADPDRVYLTGLSLGGFGTWDTAFEYPGTFAAIAPICGGAGIRWTMAAKIKHLPCRIYHGDADTAVPVEFSQKIHAALKKAGSTAELIVYPGVAHDSWTRTYDDPQFWQWLFAQKRQPAQE